MNYILGEAVLRAFKQDFDYNRRSETAKYAARIGVSLTLKSLLWEIIAIAMDMLRFCFFLKTPAALRYSSVAGVLQTFKTHAIRQPDPGQDAS